MEQQYTKEDATSLNKLKNQIREVTKFVDTLPVKVYPDTIEAKQVKHEISVLLSELAVHGLLPASVDSTPDREPAAKQWKISIDMKTVDPADVWTVLSLAWSEAIEPPFQGFRFLLVRYRTKQTTLAIASQIERAVKSAAIEVEED